MQAMMEINRLLMYMAPYKHTWNAVETQLEKTKNLLEDIYFTQVLRPKLNNVIAAETNAYMRCIMFILWIIGRPPSPVEADQASLHHHIAHQVSS